MSLVRLFRRLAVILPLALAAIYAGDYLSARYRIPNNRQTLGTVQVRTSYAVKLKNGRVDYELGDTYNQACLRSLFPHLGYETCWYLRRHSDNVIVIGLLWPISPRLCATPQSLGPGSWGCPG
jgi:hypothetical protein